MSKIAPFRRIRCTRKGVILMVKRIGSLVVLLALILAIPAHAASLRLVDVLPNISFAMQLVRLRFMRTEVMIA